MSDIQALKAQFAESEPQYQPVDLDKLFWPKIVDAVKARRKTVKIGFSDMLWDGKRARFSFFKGDMQDILQLVQWSITKGIRVRPLIEMVHDNDDRMPSSSKEETGIEFSWD